VKYGITEIKMGRIQLKVPTHLNKFEQLYLQLLNHVSPKQISKKYERKLYFYNTNIIYRKKKPKKGERKRKRGKHPPPPKKKPMYI
jgi:hypothetical protein